MHDQRLRTVRLDADGIGLEVDDHGGDGLPLLLLHGGGGDRSAWTRVVPLLAPQFRVVAYDAPGHGRSETPPTWTTTTMSDAVRAVANTLELDRPVLVGHSMGGVTAVRYALAGGRCRGIVCVEGAVVRTDEPIVHVDAVSYRDELRRHGVPEERLDFFVSGRLAGEELAERETVAMYARIPCPLLIVTAERGMTGLGPYTDRQRRVLDDLGAIWLDCGHRVPSERPDEVAALVREFASRIGELP